MSQSEIIFEVNIRKPIEKTQDDSSNDNCATIITKSEVISYDDNIELEHSKKGNHHDCEDKESNSTICVEINATDTTEISAEVNNNTSSHGSNNSVVKDIGKRMQEKGNGITEVNEGNTKEDVIDVKNFMIDVTGSDEEIYQHHLSMSVNDIIDTLSQNEPFEKLMDTKEKVGECEKKDRDDLTESIMNRMETFNAANTVDSMELYRLREKNQFPVSATTEESDSDGQIVIVRKKNSGKKKKDRMKEK